MNHRKQAPGWSFTASSRGALGPPQEGQDMGGGAGFVRGEGGPAGAVGDFVLNGPLYRLFSEAAFADLSQAAVRLQGTAPLLQQVSLSPSREIGQKDRPDLSVRSVTAFYCAPLNSS